MSQTSRAALSAAIAGLGGRRRAMAAACADSRDASAAIGDVALAAFWSELMALLLVSEAEERDVLAALDFTPGVEVLGIERPGEPGDSNVG